MGVVNLKFIINKFLSLINFFILNLHDFVQIYVQFQIFCFVDEMFFNNSSEGVKEEPRNIVAIHVNCRAYFDMTIRAHMHAYIKSN
jgi:hypothetical protein